MYPIMLYTVFRRSSLPCGYTFSTQNIKQNAQNTTHMLACFICVLLEQWFFESFDFQSRILEKWISNCCVIDHIFRYDINVKLGKDADEATPYIISLFELWRH